MSGALHGCRVLITRAQHQAGELAAQLAAAGAEVISIPAIEIVEPVSWIPFDAALRGIAKFEWLVLTSANAVEALVLRLALVSGPVDFSEVKIAVIGPATARAVEAAGMHVALMPKEAVAEELAACLMPVVAGANVLLMQAGGARDILAVELARAGASVTAVEAYRNVEPEGSADAVRDLFLEPDRKLGAVVFTSSSTARNFFHLLELSGIALPEGVVLASIGPVTSRTVRELGYVADVEAEEHTIPGLVMAMEKHFLQG